MLIDSMDFPDIHSCTRFAAENVDLKKHLQRVRQKRDQIERELNALKEQKKVEDLLRNYVTTRDVYVQTEPRPWQPGKHYSYQKPPEDSGKESAKTNKILNMHTQLMKRYEREIKQNLAHVETISDLNVKITDLEIKIRDEKEKVLRLEAGVIGSKGHTDCELRDVIRERSKLKKENKKLRKELDGLDENFFDEIEDVKFAFQQSARLNKEYEKALHKLCHKFGVPYPHPEQALFAADKHADKHAAKSS